MLQNSVILNKKLVKFQHRLNISKKDDPFEVEDGVQKCFDLFIGKFLAINPRYIAASWSYYRTPHPIFRFYETHTRISVLMKFKLGDFLTVI